MHRYEVILYWSDEDQAIVAEVPELPGCLAHGATREETVKEVEVAMQLWIDTANECGDPVPETKGRRFVFA